MVPHPLDSLRTLLSDSHQRAALLSLWIWRCLPSLTRRVARALVSVPRHRSAWQHLLDGRWQCHRSRSVTRDAAHDAFGQGSGTRAAGRCFRSDTRRNRRVGRCAAGVGAGSNLAGRLAPIESGRGPLCGCGEWRIAAHRVRGPGSSGTGRNPDRVGPILTRRRRGAGAFESARARPRGCHEWRPGNQSRDRQSAGRSWTGRRPAHAAAARVDIGPSALRDWLSSIVADSETFEPWFTRLTGLLGSGLPAPSRPSRERELSPTRSALHSCLFRVVLSCSPSRLTPPRAAPERWFSEWRWS